MNFFSRIFFAIALGSLVLAASGCAMKHKCCGHEKTACAGGCSAGACGAEGAAKADKKGGSCGGEMKAGCGSDSCGKKDDAKAGGSCGK